ncbi:MAG TPA: hypothetical protein VLD83_02890 [Candidatus Binatia bacterium]|nr:hypothetical protein [Candidatus Binatia bacterium]
MSTEAEIVRKQLFELIRLERRRRREQILAGVFFYALLVALLMLPFHPLLPVAISRYLMPILVFSLLAPVFLIMKRWRVDDTARAVARVDKTLRLDERTLTAWELLERNETRAAALWVLKEAGEKLAAFHPRALLRRHWSWQARLAFPLLAVWLGLVWLGVGLQLDSAAEFSGPKTLAQKLREFSRDLQEKAKIEGLQESLRMGRELEQLAQKSIEAKTDDEKLKSELAGIKKQVETTGKSAEPSLSGAGSQRDLRDLKAELEAARDILNMPAAKGADELGQQWLDQLATLPQLKRQFDRQNQKGGDLGHNDLKSFLDKLEKQATGELDRRTLLEAQQFLDQLMKQGHKDRDESDVQTAGQGKDEWPEDSEKANNASNLPGKEPGKREAGDPSLPNFPAGAAAHVKGLLGEGKSRGLELKGKPSAGKSEVSQDEVIASYRRQAEAELNTERVPDGLKETIKNYFLSLGIGEEAK